MTENNEEIVLKLKKNNCWQSWKESYQGKDCVKIYLSKSISFGNVKFILLLL